MSDAAGSGGNSGEQLLQVDGPVYEMLWDCAFCGTHKLLGLTHRHCPVCGAPQAADARYFPPDDQKVPAKDHVYYGVDRKCGSCGEANSRASKHCRGCGAPLEGMGDVKVQREGAPPVLKPPVPNAPAKKRKKRRLVTAGVVLGGSGLVASLLWSKPAELQVVQHVWHREISVERFGPVQDSAWCDSVPSDGHVIHRGREVRDHRKVEDGEDCSTHKVDLGNGGFTEKEECHPRYRDEPVYDDRCTYVVNRWQSVRSEKLDGASLADPPRWPSVRLERPGQCVGCEREGARSETFTVVLRESNGSEHRCDFDQAKWSALADGTSLEGSVGVVTDALRCGSLHAR